MDPIFSYFDYRTRALTAGSAASAVSIRFYAEAADQQAGRFWMGLLHAFRRVFPAIGQELLSGMLEHQQQPGKAALARLSAELADTEWQLTFENWQAVQGSGWWPGFLEWLRPLQAGHGVIFTQAQTFDRPGETGQEGATEISAAGGIPAACAGLAGWDVFWAKWLEAEYPAENWPAIWNELRIANNVTSLSPNIIIPKPALLRHLRGRLGDDAFPLITQQIWRLSAWLVEQGQWLEAFRCLLFVKDFEQAGELFAEYGPGWLVSEANALEVLFWLKELPGVLLTSRTGLCLLAAQAASQLGWNLQTSYYLNAAENELFALQRLSRNDGLWRAMALDENGSTVQHRLDQIQSLRDRGKL